MEAVRQVVNSNSLDGIVTLPKPFHNKKVEIIITLIDDSVTPTITKSDIASLLSGSVTEMLVGAIPNTGKSLNDYRSERLSKYESAD